WRNGKRDRKTVSSKSFKTAQAKLNKIKKQLAEHGDLPTAELTLEQWLNIWLEKIIKKRARPGTYRRYNEHAKFHFIPAAGKKKLSRLTTDDVRAIHDHYRDAGLSAASAAGGHRTLVTALNDAVKDQKLFGPNVAKFVDAPRVGDPDPETLNLEEFGQFMHIARRNPRTWSRWISAFQIGPRQGETLGLRLDFIDWEKKTVDISWQLQDLIFEHGCGR